MDRSDLSGSEGNAAGGSQPGSLGGKVLPEAPRIRHYIAALAASGAHQKLVMKGDESKVKEDGGREAGEMVQRTRMDRGVPSQRRVVQKKKNQQTMVDIMMLLNTNHLSDIRQEFMKAEEGLDLNRFVSVMLEYLSKDSVNEEHLVASLCELFAQVDVNGDATMEWDEFYGYIHEQGMAEGDRESSSMMKYNPKTVWEDRTLPKKTESVTYYQGTDWIGISVHNSVKLQIYDIVARRPVHNLTHKAAVLASAYVENRGKKLIVVSTCDYGISLWDTQSVWEATGFAEIAPPMQASESQTSLVWDPDTRTLYSGGVNGTVFTWDLDLHEQKPAKLQGHKSSVRCILDVPSLNGVITASLDATMMLWDKLGGKQPRKVYKGHRNGILGVAYSPDLKIIVSAGITDELLVWNPFVTKKIAELTGHKASLLGLHIVESRVGAYQMLSSDRSGVFKVWDLRSLECIQTFSCAPELQGIRQYMNLAHKNLVIAASGRRFQEFEFSYSNTPELTDDQEVVAALYNATLDSFVTAAGCGVRVWDPSTGTPTKTFANITQSPIISMCFDDRQRKFFLGDAHGNVTCHNYINGVLMKEFEAHTDEVTELLYCNQDKCLITASWDRTMCIHDDMDNDEGVLLRTMKGHSKDITCVANSFSLKLVATSGADGHILVWHYGLGLLEGTCKGHAQDVTQLRFMEPHPLLLSSDILGNIVVWGVPPIQAAHRFKCLLRIKNILLEQVYSVVLCSAHFADEDKFVTGDEAGEIKVRSIRDFVKSKDIRPVPEPPAPSVQELRLRRRGTTQIPLPTAPNPRTSFTDHVRGPPPGLSDPFKLLPVTQQWRGHDCVRSMSAIEAKRELITIGFDHLVKIWNLDGQHLGTLRQGNTVLEDWSFVPGTDKKYALLKQEATQVLGEIRQDAAGPDKDKAAR